MSSDDFVVQVRDQRGIIIRPTVNKNWKFSMFLYNLSESSGGIQVQSIGVDDYIYSVEKHETKTLSQLGFVPNKQVVAYANLNSG